ncbi:hypothetical protein TNCV_648731 [Trichonephila clavipes]|uniref:Uncharacterized protein n=1 Tax=Trichonephila clavipes TaxID=2585209 RepID=A0A8X6SNJ1_TRICX|nr:hypothetical protein TNCV_648731 [Trichonephila clavipes]
MKIHPEETRSYAKNCPEIQPLTPKHTFECPDFIPRLKLSLIPLMDSLKEILYRQNALELAVVVVATFGGI